MNEKMRSCVMGLLLGQFSSPLPMAQKEPVAYLYNGVRLPNINTVWTDEVKKTHPYAYIGWVLHSNSYDLFLTSCPMYYRNATVAFSDDGSWMKFYAGSENGNWLHDGTYSAIKGDRILELFNFTWASTDFLNEDGSVKLAASEPIPVYE